MVTATVTGVTGAGQSVTSLALSGITEVIINHAAGAIFITYTPTGTNSKRVFELMLSGLTTVSYTISGADVAWVFS